MKRLPFYLLRAARMARTPHTGSLVSPTKNVTSHSSGMEAKNFKSSAKPDLFSNKVSSPSSPATCIFGVALPPSGIAESESKVAGLRLRLGLGLGLAMAMAAAQRLLPRSSPEPVDDTSNEQSILSRDGRRCGGRGCGARPTDDANPMVRAVWYGKSEKLGRRSANPSYAQSPFSSVSNLHRTYSSSDFCQKSKLE